MKFIIIGLGNFGGSLGAKLTELGHEVFGIDKNMEKVEMIKNKITHAICMDSTDTFAVQSLPIRDADIAVVTIGENDGASLISTALLKQLQVKRLISRSLSPLHRTILEAMGIDEIIQPEEDSAERLAKKLDMKGVVDAFMLCDPFNIIEAKVPVRYVGKTVEEVDFRRRYKVNILTIIKTEQQKNILGISKKTNRIKGVALPEDRIEADDVLVLFGDISDIRRLLDE